MNEINEPTRAIVARAFCDEDGPDTPATVVLNVTPTILVALLRCCDIAARLKEALPDFYGFEAWNGLPIWYASTLDTDSEISVLDEEVRVTPSLEVRVDCETAVFTEDDVKFTAFLDDSDSAVWSVEIPRTFFEGVLQDLQPPDAHAPDEAHCPHCGSGDINRSMSGSRVPVYTAEDMDQKVSCGCDAPGCGCKSGPMFIHSKCCGAHPAVLVESGSRTLRLLCSECGRPILSLLLSATATLLPQESLWPSPCCGSALECSYERGSGVLHLHCDRCDAEVARLTLARRSVPWPQIRICLN